MSNNIFRDNYVPTWEVLPITILYLTRQRNALNRNESINSAKKKKIIAGLNYSIVINSAYIIEGALDNFLKVLIKIKLQDKDRSPFEENLIMDFMNRVSSASFHQYKALFRSVLNFSLADLFNGPNTGAWKDTLFLFELRNMLAHGESIGLDYGEEYPAIHYEKKPNQIKAFLTNKSLIKTTLQDGDLHLEDILNREVADFCYETAIHFLYIVTKGVSNYPNPILNKERLDKIFNVII